MLVAVIVPCHIFELIWKCSLIFLTNTASLLAWQIVVTGTSPMSKQFVTCCLKWLWINRISQKVFYLTYLTFYLLFFFLLQTTLFLQLLSSDCSTFLVHYKYGKLVYRAMPYRRKFMCICTPTSSHMTSISEQTNYSLFLPSAFKLMSDISVLGRCEYSACCRLIWLQKVLYSHVPFARMCRFIGSIVNVSFDPTTST